MLTDDFDMECYICTDQCDTLSPCTCEQLYLHEDCYAKLLAYDHKKCTVCNTPFPLEIEDVVPELSVDSMEEEDERPRKPNKMWVLVPIYLRPRDICAMYEADILIELIRTPIWIFMIMILFSMGYNEPMWNDWYDFRGHVDLYVSALVTMMMMSIFVKSWCFSDCFC